MSADLEKWLEQLKTPREKWKPGDYCDRCNNTGEIDCRCGGDLCICGQQEIECPRCRGMSGQPFDAFEGDY